MTDDETRRGWAYLSRVAELLCPELSTLLTHNGPVEAAERVRRISPVSAHAPGDIVMCGSRKKRYVKLLGLAGSGTPKQLWIRLDDPESLSYDKSCLRGFA